VEKVKAQSENPKFKMKNRPFVTIKYAQTLDGKIADQRGKSKWISGPPARKFAHRLRTRHQAILVGVNTVIKDDPLLTVRLVKGKNPLRIILDSQLRLPLKAKVINRKMATGTMIATTRKASRKKVELLKKRGVKLLFIPGSNGNVDLHKLLNVLKSLKIKSILVEGGSKVITSFLKDKLVDRMVVVLSSKIMGKGIEAIGDLKVSDINKIFNFRFKRIEKIGQDLVLTINLNNI